MSDEINTFANVITAYSSWKNASNTKTLVKYAERMDSIARFNSCELKYLSYSMDVLKESLSSISSSFEYLEKQATEKEKEKTKALQRREFLFQTNLMLKDLSKYEAPIFDEIGRAHV